MVPSLQSFLVRVQGNMREAGVAGIELNELDRNNEPGVRGGASQGRGQSTFMVSDQQ